MSNAPNYLILIAIGARGMINKTICLFLSLMLLASCSMTDLPYAYDGASGYERFAVPIRVNYPETTIKSSQVALVGQTIVFETSVSFENVKEVNHDVSIETSKGKKFGKLIVGQSFVGVDATLVSANWGAVMFGGVVDATTESDSDVLYCTRVLAPEEKPISRVVCFGDTDDDGLMDSLYAPFNSSFKRSGYLPSAFTKKVLAEFEPFELSSSDAADMQGQLKLIGSVTRDESWLGPDEYYYLRGDLIPAPNPNASNSWKMTTILPSEGTEYASRIDWLNGVVSLSRDTESDEWTVLFTFPSEALSATLNLDYEIGKY